MGKLYVYELYLNTAVKKSNGTPDRIKKQMEGGEIERNVGSLIFWYNTERR